MLQVECIPCQYGNHDEHTDVIHAPPPGMIGGASCPCRGECRDRPRTPDPSRASGVVPDGRRWEASVSRGERRRARSYIHGPTTEGYETLLTVAEHERVLEALREALAFCRFLVETEAPDA